MAESYARPKASNAPYALSKVAQLTCVYRTFFFSLVCRSLPTPLTSAVAAAARSLSEAVSSSYGRSPSQDVIDFYTKMSDTVLLAMFFLPLISLAVLGVQTLLDSGKVSKEEMKQRDEDEEAMIKAKAAESLYAPGDVKGGTV